MRKKITLSLMSLLVICHVTTAKVWINEFMQSNIDCVRDDLNDFPDSWVELYNDSEEDIDIIGWYLSDKKNHEKGWKIPESTLIPANGYLLIYCDKAETGLHTSFRLESGKGCNIYLFDSDGNVIDQALDFPKQPAPNIACGREEDAGPDWTYFVRATPGKKNEGTTSDTLLPSPVFSITGGVYNDSVEVSLSLPEDVAEDVVLSDIRYTIDGSEPTAESSSYAEPIKITQPTPIRAKIITQQYLVNRSVTQTYIVVDRELTLPVIAINLDPEFLWDDEFGIYVRGNEINGMENYRNNWRRPMNVEYFPLTGEESVINQLEEMRLSGNYSRSMPQKSLILYANKRFGEKRYNYQLFSEKPNQEIKSFIVRNSGNDFWSTMFRDAAIQLFMGRKVDLDYQEYQPAILFLNGEYYGIQNLRERSNEDFVVANYDGLEDIDMIENWPGTNSELKAGDMEAMNDMMEKLGLPDDQIPYQEIINRVDVDEFLNYMILQIYVANTDFPEGNVVIWRPKTEGGKWRLLLKDTDLGLNFSNPVDFNALEHNINAQNPSKKLFTKLLNEPTVRKEFYTRFAIYMGDILHPNTTTAVIDSIQQMIDTEMRSHKQKWLWDYRDYPYWLNAVDRMKVWCENRNVYMIDHLNDEFRLKGVVPVQIATTELLIESPVLTFNNIELEKPVFDGAYFIGETIKLKIAGKELADNIGWYLKYHVRSREITEEVMGNELEFVIPEGCTQVSIEVMGDLTSVNEVNDSSIQMVVRNNALYVDGLKGTTVIGVYDTVGRLLTEKRTDESTLVVPLQQKGVFFVRINEDSKSETRKVVNE